MKPYVVSVNISKEKGTPKQPVPAIVITTKGVENDAHAGTWHRQVSLLSREVITDFESKTGRKIKYGEFAENITTAGLNLREVNLLDKIIIGRVKLTVTQIGKECHGDTCAIFREVGKCIMPKEGIFCRVECGGRIRAGDKIVHEPKPLRIFIITASDRASRGEYQDKSGPEIEQRIRNFFQSKRWMLEIRRQILPDKKIAIKKALRGAIRNRADIIFITGGTGIGPRDITPEVVTGFCDKVLPGIMEYIRIKYAANNPKSLLSRSVAGVKGQTLIYALPGSVKAVSEYMNEILLTLEHAIFMLHGIDVHAY